MPLNEQVTFKVPLRKFSRLRIPKIIRQQFKLETTQNLKITITVANALADKETFFGKMRKDGYITVPPNPLFLLKEDRPTLENHLLDVTLEPL